MIIQGGSESRKDYLIRVAIDYLEDHANLNCLIEYDDATCDGQCLIDDLIIVLDEEDDTK